MEVRLRRYAVKLISTVAQISTQAMPMSLHYPSESSDSPFSIVAFTYMQASNQQGN